MAKTATVESGSPTGMLFGILAENWFIVLMILLVAGVYFKKEQLRTLLGIGVV